MILQIFSVLALLVMLFDAPCALAQDALTVFAAASTKNALDEINLAFAKASGKKIVVSYAATSALAKQIEQGAPADIFLSADPEWMNYAVERKLISDDTRFNLLGNRLVLIAPKDSEVNQVAIDKNFDIAGLAAQGPTQGRIAIADTNAVPAGRYAKAALKSLGMWDAAKSKLAPAENVRAVLAYVARGEAPIGIVYETDARVEPDVKIIAVFSENSHPPIIYSVAVVAASKNINVTHYLKFLRTTQAKTIFERYGFRYLLKPSS